MKFRWPWQKRTEEDELASLDAMLQSTFQPVTPRNDFMSSLRETLIAGEKKVMGLSRRTFQQLLLVLGAIASGLVLILTGIRTILTILGTFGRLRKKEEDQEPQEPVSEL